VYFYGTITGLFKISFNNLTLADPRDRGVSGVGLRPPASWDCEFEYRWGHGSVSCEWCWLSGSGLCDGPIPRPEESYRVQWVWVWLRSLDIEEALAHYGLYAPWEEEASIRD